MRCLTSIALAALISTVAWAGDGTCVRVSEACVQGPETRTISGQSVYRDCWQYRASFDCASASPISDCRALADQGCSQVSSKCVETLANGECALFEQTYACKVANGSTRTVQNCGSQSFCVSGNCFETGYTPDADFAKSVAVLEAQREAGQYLDPENLEVFQGHDNRCRKKLFGLVNCCKGGGGSDTSLFSNLNLILGAGGQAVSAVGSSYTYDALFLSDAPQAVLTGFETLFGAGGGSSALAGVLAGDLSVESFIGALAPGPWTIAILAIQLSGILNCEQAEQILSMKRDTRLCHGVGSYCSTRLPIIRVCTETSESYCCFNSRLARIINEQGRAQLGRGWGAPDAPSCSGFSLAQLQALDFSRMDLSEFYAEVAPTLPDTGAMRERTQQKLESYFRR